MNQNVGTLDRGVRIVAGVALIAATLMGYIGPWGWIGVVPLATGLFRFCPAYLPLGLSTCATRGGTGNRK
ncbi:YgaP family membrane protein [Methylibium sp.]|uniref:YgaP family membrane protein n=1 Tax=Methylibium sp. TaxID=2067992 RepID=UPI003D114BE5